MKFFCAFVAGLWITAVASAEPNKDYPTIDDTSFIESNGNRVICLSVEVAALPEDVWRTLTTAEGWKSFAVAFAEMEMKVGGVIETSYKPTARMGDPDNIKNEIVAYVPGKMMAIRCIQAPRNFQHKQEFFATSTVFELLPVGGQKTRMVVTAEGYRPGEAYDELFRKFRRGDAYTLEKLRSRFDKSSKSPATEAKSQDELEPPKKDAP